MIMSSLPKRKTQGIDLRPTSFYLYSSDFQGATMLEQIRKEKSECEKVSLNHTTTVLEISNCPIARHRLKSRRTTYVCLALARRTT